MVRKIKVATNSWALSACTKSTTQNIRSLYSYTLQACFIWHILLQSSGVTPIVLCIPASLYPADSQADKADYCGFPGEGVLLVGYIRNKILPIFSQINIRLSQYQTAIDIAQ